MQNANTWERILLAIGRAQSASDDDETRFIAGHLNKMFDEQRDEVEKVYNVQLDELIAENLRLRGNAETP